MDAVLNARARTVRRAALEPRGPSPTTGGQSEDHLYRAGCGGQSPITKRLCVPVATDRCRLATDWAEKSSLTLSQPFFVSAKWSGGRSVRTSRLGALRDEPSFDRGNDCSRSSAGSQVGPHFITRLAMRHHSAT